MAKVVVTRLNGAAGPVRKSASVSERRVRGADGKLRTLVTLDMNSKSFGDDLTNVFRKNVAKARRENKRVTGVADRAPAKG